MQDYVEIAERIERQEEKLLRVKGYDEQSYRS